MKPIDSTYLFETVLINLVQQGKTIEFAIESAIKAKAAFDAAFTRENSND